MKKAHMQDKFIVKGKKAPDKGTLWANFYLMLMIALQHL